ncbi:MAG TPA: protein kinase, partial [Gemmatimonadaceae bacterium]|nr:protein kinase [Gemmatimonadaceae bacterium]
MIARGRLSDTQTNDLKELFEQAVTLKGADRDRFVTGSCVSDETLRTELSSLLDAFDNCGDYFERLADEIITPVLLAVASSEADEPIGTDRRISHYEVLERIGGGGMGVVYKARDLRLGRTVALKFLPTRHAADPTAQGRLLAEAQTASALDHPNIGVVYEIGETETKRPFIAMAWYDGETLKQKIRKGPLPVRDAVTIALQLADALATAHSAGIIHRDVKPANVIITPSGTAKLVDFGIAKMMSTEPADERIAIGTTAYMSPEQTRGAAFDARTDIWSLGVVLYEMLTGRRPFREDTDQQVMDAIRNKEPDPVSTQRADLPGKLIDVVHRCLQKNIADRFETAEQFAAAIRESLNGDADAPRPKATRARRFDVASWRRHRSMLVATALLILVGAAWGSGAVRRSLQGNAIANDLTSQPKAVAVVPFINAAGIAADEHLTAGFTDGLIDVFAKVPGIRVAARGSAFALKRRGLSSRAIADSLGAETLVEGDLRRTGERFRLTVRLIRVADGSVLWSEEYDRLVADVFAVQQQISSALVQELDLATADKRAESQRPPTRDVEAYELYLKGRFSWNERTRPKLEEALAYYRAAIERDPQFALAYSGMAEAYVNMSNFEYMPSAEALARAEVAASRAIALDSTLAEAHSSRGFVLASRGAYAASEAAFRRSIRLNRSYSWSHHYYALLLTMLGRLDEATHQVNNSLALDPLSLPSNATLGVLLCARGRFADARTQLRHALTLSPDFPLTRYYLGVVEAKEGRYADASRDLEHARKFAPGFPGARAALAYTYKRAGRDADARRLA